MPFKVTGEDGRVLHDNLSDHDARVLAGNVHAATGEQVTLTPLVFNDKRREYVEDADGVVHFGAKAEPEPEPEADGAAAAEKPKRTRRAPKK